MFQEAKGNHFLNQPDLAYEAAESKAADYFHRLYNHVMDRSYEVGLTEDFSVWKKSHVHFISRWLPYLYKKSSPSDSLHYKQYINQLNKKGKLDAYLDRSLSYIYMRDLGKALDDPKVGARISSAVAEVKQQLIRSLQTPQNAEISYVSMSGWYRWGQKEGTEDTIIWLSHKLKTVNARLPEELNPVHAQRKLIKIIAGVLLHVMDELDDLEEKLPRTERSNRLDHAIRLGYYYGLTYPFIDDILDSTLITEEEKERYSNIIRSALLTGTVPDLGEWSGQQVDLMTYIHAELSEAFLYIQKHQSPGTRHIFFEQSYVFFESQDRDRRKKLDDPHYTNEQLYLSVILKSASSRLIARSVLSAPLDEGFDDRTFYYGIYNQLADDFADMFDDLKNGAVTPYTYFLKYHQQRNDIVNPFEMYLAVIFHLIHHVYHSDFKTREVILNRVINGLKRARVRLGDQKYKEIMDLFTKRISKFNVMLQHLVRTASDVDFFDKLLRDEMLNSIKSDRVQQEEFWSFSREVKERLNKELPLTEASTGKENGDSTSLVSAANYSLTGDGKRLRSMLAWVMGVKAYGLSEESMMPLLKSLEYMHTASLIFDDLPSQDNSSTRRGRTTLHEKYSSATAELSALLLIQKGVQEQAMLTKFDPSTVLSLMRYSAEKAEEMCIGQGMDLRSRGHLLTVEQLRQLCFLKTGVAFEASLVMPAILAKATDEELNTIKRFAYHTGIAFQIKDDLLDAQGNERELGKPAGQDMQNNSSTFVSILGEAQAEREMWEHYCEAMEALQQFTKSTDYLKHILGYIVHRDR